MKRLLLLVLCLICVISFALTEGNESNNIPLPPATDVEGNPVDPIYGKEFITKNEMQTLLNDRFADASQKFLDWYGDNIDVAFSLLDVKIKLLLSYVNNEFISSIDDISIDGNGKVSVKYTKSNISKYTNVTVEKSKYSDIKLRASWMNNNRSLYITENGSDHKEIPLGQSILQKIGAGSQGGVVKLRHYKPNASMNGQQEDIELPSAEAVVESTTAGGLDGYNVQLWNRDGQKLTDFDVIKNLTQIDNLEVVKSGTQSKLKLKYKDSSGVQQTKEVSIDAITGQREGDGVSITLTEATEQDPFQKFTIFGFDDAKVASSVNPAVPQADSGMLRWWTIDQWVDGVSLEKISDLAQFGIKDWGAVAESDTMVDSMFDNSVSTGNFLSCNNDKAKYYAVGSIADRVEDGIEVNANKKLAVKPKENGGIDVSKDGVSVKVAADGGLVGGKDGLFVKLRDNGGLSVDKNGLGVNTTGATKDSVLSYNGSAVVWSKVSGGGGGAPVDDASITTNTAHGALYSGFASLYDFANATGGASPYVKVVNGVKTLAWGSARGSFALDVTRTQGGYSFTVGSGYFLYNRRASYMSSSSPITTTTVVYLKIPHANYSNATIVGDGSSHESDDDITYIPLYHVNTTNGGFTDYRGSPSIQLWE